MPYLRKTIKHGEVIEVHKYFNGRYMRKKGNAPPLGETPPEQKKWQEKKATQKVWGLLDENFEKGDLWTTLTYPAGTKPTAKQVRDDMQHFLRKMRKAFKKAGKELKYIYSAGRGKRGAAHIHIVLPKFDIDAVRDSWAEIVNAGDYVRCDFKPLQAKKDYYKLAEYIIKNSKEDFESDDPVYKKRYCASRNLKKPKERVEKINHKTWKKEAPEKKGYYIDKARSWDGINCYGYPVQYTVYVKLGGAAGETETGGRADREILQEQEPDTLRRLQNRLL